MSEKKPTMKDTKQVILDAYYKAQEQLEELKRGSFNPEVEKKNKKVEESKKVVSEGLTSKEEVEDKILAVKRTLDITLSSISETIIENLKLYDALQESIKAQKEELEEVYGIKVEAESLVALVNTKESLKAEYEESFAERKALAEKALEELRITIADEKEKLKAELEEERKKAQLEHEREEEEYNYNFNRKKKQKEDELYDLLLNREKAFEVKQQNLVRDLSLKSEALDKREEELIERETQISALEEEIETLKESREEAIAEAVKKARDQETSKFYSQKALYEKDAEHKIEIAQNEAKNLRELYEQAIATNKELSEKVEKAHAEIREIATKTIDNAGDKKVINQLERIVSQKNSN